LRWCFNDRTRRENRNPGRIRLAIFSEVKLDNAGNARPIHMLRCGTFTDSSGKSFTFEPRHIQSIVQNYAKRPNPPITESHDWGRAVGRTTNLYADATGENLYGMPKWNAAGKQMLVDGVYDGYSCELDPDGAGGFVKIGGSLTNYPAVHGLQPVTLTAPPIDDPLTQPKETPMADEVETPVAPPVIAPPATSPVVPPVALSAPDSPIFQAQMQAALTQMQAQYEAQARSALESAQLQFERWKSEQAASQEIAQFAQHVTSATLQRPYALPLDADRISKFMASIPADARKEARLLFEQILSAGLVSFEELGSQGEGKDAPNPIEAYEEALAAEIKLTGIRSQAIANLMRKQPEIVSAYNAARNTKKGGR
jgi:hypothetical protein